MADEIDWSQYKAEPSSENINWDQFASGNEEQSNSFPQMMEDFYRTFGIHGANRGFSKIFGFGPHQENAQHKYEEAVKTNPWANEIGNVAAQAYSSVPFMMAGTGAAGAIPGINPTFANIAGSALGGGAMGALETPNEDQSRTSNSLTDAMLSAAFASAVPVAKGAYNFAKKVPSSVSKEKIATKIGEGFAQNKQKYSGLYGDLFNAAEQEGIKTSLPGSDLPDRALRRIIKKATNGIDEQTRKPIVKAFKTNSPEDVHAAKSKLGEFIRSENKIKRNGGRIDNDALQRAKQLKKELGQELSEALNKSEQGLGVQYKDITKGYRKEVVPYSRNPAIQEFSVGDSVAKDLIKSLRGSSKSGKLFRSHLAEQYPEVKTNQILENVLKGGLGLGVVGGGLYKLFGGQ